MYKNDRRGGVQKSFSRTDPKTTYAVNFIKQLNGEFVHYNK